MQEINDKSNQQVKINDYVVHSNKRTFASRAKKPKKIKKSNLDNNFPSLINDFPALSDTEFSDTEMMTSQHPSKDPPIINTHGVDNHLYQDKPGTVVPTNHSNNNNNVPFVVIQSQNSVLVNELAKISIENLSHIYNVNLIETPQYPSLIKLMTSRIAHYVESHNANNNLN